jgi:aryl-alcohol dehydrogenase-like predicted oxidoreductase
VLAVESEMPDVRQASLDRARELRIDVSDTANYYGVREVAWRRRRACTDVR